MYSGTTFVNKNIMFDNDRSSEKRNIKANITRFLGLGCWLVIFKSNIYCTATILLTSIDVRYKKCHMKEMKTLIQ